MWQSMQSQADFLIKGVVWFFGQFISPFFGIKDTYVWQREIRSLEKVHLVKNYVS